jgi:WhiB family transcriptional regulator, redox-sensing transcriptional regulator
MAVDLTSTTEWREFGRCRGRSQLFFAPTAERPEAREKRERQAMALCDDCAVKLPCREAGRRNLEYGFWGGETEQQRVLAGFAIRSAIGVKRGRPVDHVENCGTATKGSL